MVVRPAAVAILCLAAGAPSADAAGRIFGWGRSTRPTRSEPQAEAKKPDPLAEFRPPGAPRIETDRSRYRPGYVSARREDTLKLVDQALDRSKRRSLAVGPNTPWQILHGTLALRRDFKVRVNGRTVNAVDWLSSGVRHKGLPLVEKTEHGGRCHPFTEPYAFEGHTNQFLAILAIAGLPAEHEFKTPGGDVVTMSDMVRHAQATVDGRGEMTWTLWFLTHYVEPDAEWETAAGQFWSMERLVQMESRHKVEDAPCGGMHRLFALALARNAYLAKHGRIGGAWLEADQKIKKYEAAARSLQNRDGSFSAAWFKGREHSYDLEKRLKTSGHTLEWLMVSVGERDLYSPWVQKAVQSVARDVTRSLSQETEAGAFYHALDALAFYKMRVTPRTEPADEPEPETTEPPQPLAKSESTPVEPPSEPIAPQPPIAEPGAKEPTVAKADAPSEPPTVAAAPLAALEAEDDSVPLLTRLPEGIDEEAAPIASRSLTDAEADETTEASETVEAPETDAEEVLVAEEPTGSQPGEDASVAADEPAPASKPTQTAEAQNPSVRQLSGEWDAPLIVEALDLPPAQLTPLPPGEPVRPIAEPPAKTVPAVDESRPIDVPMATQWATPVRTR